MISIFVSVLIKVFFLMTPFFALSMFLSYTADYTLQQKRRTAIKTTLAVISISLLIYWFGEYLFKVLGITIDAFRIGAGIVLLLTAISLVNGPSGSSCAKKISDDVLDITVVPLAMPTIVGPGTIGALLVMGADGGIGSTYNFMADKFVKIRELFAQNRIQEAQQIQKEANRIITLLCKIGVMQAEKEVLNQLGFDFGCCRKPFGVPTEEEKELIAKQIIPYL